MTGWAKIYRSLADHELWLAEPFTYGQAWVDIFLNANHSPGSFMVKRQRVSLERGQLGWSEITMTERWKWSRGKVRRFLKRLSSDGMIEQQAGHLTSIITICNYDDYQGKQKEGDTSDGTAGSTADGTRNEHLTVQQAVHKQECKEELELKNSKKTPLPAAAAKPSDDVYQIFTYWRDVMKKTNSAKCTPKRTKAVKGRLDEGYSVDDIKGAIFGCSVTPHNMGQQSSTNPAGKRFDCLELICRNGENVERFKSNGESISPADQKQAEIDDWIAGTEQQPMTDYPEGETLDHESF
jgi:hypothetical protein